MMWVGSRVVAWAAVCASVGVRAVVGSCTMAEFPCKNKQCISLDRYCDGTKDCDDDSDEPNPCSHCKCSADYAAMTVARWYYK
ncbi:hypothetical protein Pmani_033700 [Petrolisthes manimaculis]|uniref:Uncharacterized protein n=1 Tax=Petrolisthes manimaculis TaxID=1843537 RepID=A0AAE1TSD0_9EUCA|nr:hypothetical protein Pmani_033700 [Petrolisthes manimaculis]